MHLHRQRGLLPIHQGRFELFESLTERSGHPVEAPDAGTQLQGKLGLALFSCPAKGRPQIVLFGGNPGPPAGRIGPQQLYISIHGEAGKIFAMALVGRRCLALLPELFLRKFPYRFQHHKPGLFGHMLPLDEASAVE